MATVSRGEPFFAFEVKEVNALEVSVVEENIEVYAVMSLSVAHAPSTCI